MVSKIEQKLKNYIATHHLIEEGDHLVVGVSGGADSMMLIDFLCREYQTKNITLTVAHIHHGLRQEADDEAGYVKSWCEAHQLRCEVYYTDLKKLRQEQKKSEEEIGREERYSFFISLTNPDDKIVTAHHKNDQIETMLMNFFRGADLRGLGGIRHTRQNVIRPLLILSRKEIEIYCNAYNIKYYEDKSNLETIYTRNKMRLQLIPYLKEYINPGIEETLAEKSTLYQEAEDFLRAYTDKLYRRCVEPTPEGMKICLKILRTEKSYCQKRLFMDVIERLLGQQKDITMKHINQCVALLQNQSGKKINLPYGIQVEREYEVIHVTVKKQEIFTNYELPLKLGINKSEAFQLHIHLTLCDLKRFEVCTENRYTKYVDYDRIKGNLLLRTRQSGDRITLSHGTKKLKKLLSDEKVPRSVREKLPLIVDDQGEIVWAVGLRQSSTYYVTETTRRLLEIKITTENNQEGSC